MGIRSTVALPRGKSLPAPKVRLIKRTGLLFPFYAALLLAGLLAGCARHDEVPQAPVSGSDSLTGFAFQAGSNSALQFDITGDIEGDTIYVHAPAGTDISDLTPIFTHTGVRLTVDDSDQVSGVSAHDFNQPVTYTVVGDDKGIRKYTVRFLDTGIPALYLSTGGVPVDSKDNYVEGTMRIVSGFPEAVRYEGKMEIKGRGNATWNMPKKPYNIKLDKKAGLLGMEENKKWSLLANYGDKSLIRNAVAFELSRRLQLAFSPASEYVDVFLNGEFLGNYELTEKIEVGSHRVNIEEQDEGATILPGISGGYLLEVDGYAYSEKSYFVTPKSMAITIHYPEDDEITPEQKSYISGHVTKFEDALFSPDFGDPATGYRKYFDLDSYINWYLVNEIMGNSDIFWSTYLYKKRNDDKIYAGPVWDFDLACNNDQRLGDAVHKMMIDAGHEPRTWINRLMEDKGFRQAVRGRWNAVKTDKVNTLPQFVDQLARQLAFSQALNFRRWDILGVKVHQNLQAAGSYPGEVDYLREYLKDRISWLDTQFNSSRFE
ncbi:CotH kinase family protein [Compostibacter hankyongensis]|uniref:CotH kinase family protein n=1 Tax=Compostibacter hankyongensis TaxID=1007089 RepID=A0ABP8FBK2_9BACT